MLFVKFVKFVKCYLWNKRGEAGYLVGTSALVMWETSSPAYPYKNKKRNDLLSPSPQSIFSRCIHGQKLSNWQNQRFTISIISCYACARSFFLTYNPLPRHTYIHTYIHTEHFSRANLLGGAHSGSPQLSQIRSCPCHDRFSQIQ